MAAGPAQTSCSTVCLAGERCFADGDVGALWRWCDNHGLAPMFYMAELEVAAAAEPASGVCLAWLDEQPVCSVPYATIMTRKAMSLMSQHLGRLLDTETR